MPWPDAWCDECNVICELDGEWNNQNTATVRLKILCNACYERGIALAVDRLSGRAARTWEKFVAQSHAELHPKQDELEKRYSLGSYQRFDWDQDTGRIVFSNKGVPKLAPRIEFIGSLSKHSGTWLWSWANLDVSETVRSRITAVRSLESETITLISPFPSGLRIYSKDGKWQQLLCTYCAERASIDRQWIMGFCFLC